MGDDNEPGSDWLLITTALDVKVPEQFHPVLDEYLDLADRERSLTIRNGTPILVAPDLSIDPLLVDYFARSDFASGAEGGRITYAREIKTWCAFLWARDRRWTEATEDDFNDYKRWRTDPDLHSSLPGEEAGVVTEGTFRKSRFALDALYAWAKRRGHVSESPVPEGSKIGRGDRRPSRDDVRTSRALWVTPATYQAWRNIGLLGRTAVRQGRAVVHGAPDPAWRGGRNQERNEAFCDLMITSALRRREQASLLVTEVPSGTDDVDLAGAVAKYGKGRVYTPLPEALAKVHAYMSGTRERAVARAKRAGRYEELERSRHLLVTVSSTTRRKDVIFHFENGPDLALDDLDDNKRLRLFHRDEQGRLEPLMLWLADDGLPMNPHSWNTVFDKANDRVQAEYARLGLAPRNSIRLSPHSLRFSFALYVLAALHRRIDEREGYSSGEGYSEGRYEQAYDVVRDLLGHARVQTTKDIYLEPVKGLRRSLLFESAANQDLSDVIATLTRGSDRVLDARTVFAEED